MPRKTKRVTITAEGSRDKGRTFVLTEMPADQAERWAIRAVLALAQSGAQVSESALQAGLPGLAAMGLQALTGVRWEQLEPLLDEMWECVRYEHKPGAPLQEIMAGVNSQIEEVTTRMTLRLALWELHLGFSLPEAPPTSGPSTASGGEPSSTTPTLLESLGGWYRRALRRS